jgi:alkanesulfonate monooxygenase SsuD/methylene tetrahydromethanopterin reductase-like flavin-dependent oxidoreductase (luciferase family)
MRVGVVIEPRLPGSVEFAQEAERFGVASLWVPEVWGYDALTGLAYLAARTSTIGWAPSWSNSARARPRCWQPPR